jgi:ABC-type lipoprotein release transport system permease subunit
MTFAAIGVTLAAVAAVASYLPARRGTQVDPVVTLKAD